MSNSRLVRRAMRIESVSSKGLAVNLTTFLVAPWACVPADLADQHASVVVAYTGTEALDPQTVYADPRQSLGPPDGKTVAVALGSELTVRFFRKISDGPGVDLRVYELGEDRAEAAIAVSADGVEFFELSPIARGLVTEYDLADVELEAVYFVRVAGLDDAGVEPGFDLDALEAVH